MQRNVDFLKEKMIAHRGIYDNEKGIPENSLLSFKLAIEKGYPIELDAQILRDHTIVVFHDHTLKRMTGVEGNIKDYTYEELKKLKLKNTKYTIPLLKEVLELVNGRVPLDIEIKISTSYRKIVKPLADLLDNYPGKYCVTSFHPFVLKWFKKNRPETIRGQLVSSFKKDKRPLLLKKALKHMICNPFTKPDLIACDIGMLPNTKIEKERKHTLIIGWTVKSEKELTFAKKYCDNVIAEKII